MKRKDKKIRDLKGRIEEIKEGINSKRNKILLTEEGKLKDIGEQLKSFEEYFSELEKDIKKLFGGVIVEDDTEKKVSGLVDELFDVMMENPKKNFDLIVKSPRKLKGVKKDIDIWLRLYQEIYLHFDKYSGIMNISGGIFKKPYAFTRQSGIVNINGGKFLEMHAFNEQSGIVNVNGGEFGGYAFSEQSGIVNVNGGKFEGIDAFAEQSGIVNVNNGEFKTWSAFTKQSGIVNVNGGKFEGGFSKQKGIVNVNGGKFRRCVFCEQSGIVNVNWGEFWGGYEFDDQSGIVNVNGGKFERGFFSQKGIVNVKYGRFWGEEAFKWQSGTVNINGGEFEGEKMFYSQKGIVDINGGEFEGEKMFYGQEGTVNVKKGDFRGTDMFWSQKGRVNINWGKFEGEKMFYSQEGIVDINEGIFYGIGIFENQRGFVRIHGNEKIRFSNSIADGMEHGFLYVMNDNVKIGGIHEDENLGTIYRSLAGGLVIAPNGAEKIYNYGATVFTVEKEDSEYDNVIVFEGEAKIDGEIYDSSKVLKELGDYVWETSIEKFKKSRKKAFNFVNELAIRYKGKKGEIDVSELLKGYEEKKREKKEITLGEFVYERLTD